LTSRLKEPCGGRDDGCRAGRRRGAATRSATTIICSVFLLTSLVSTVSAYAATTGPVALIEANGETMKGFTTASPSGGGLSVGNARVMCSGSYEGVSPTLKVSFPIICTDGRRGFARQVRDGSNSGNGTIEMTDGAHANYVFGPTAKDFE
jgi:hypothetical protein